MGNPKKRPAPQLHSNDDPNKKQKTASAMKPIEPIVASIEPACDEEIDDSRFAAHEETRLREMVIEHTIPSDTEDDENDETVANIEVPMRDLVKRVSREKKSLSFELECEWNNCGFMSGVDRKYFQHVEEHAYTAEENESQGYECEWAECDFRHSNHSDFLGHVHFHAQHTKLKMHGAHISELYKFPKCEGTRSNRNDISSYPTSYTCEWRNCDESFNKAVEFYHHVRYHVIDMYPSGIRLVSGPFRCGWSDCSRNFVSGFQAVAHVKKHAKQFEIGCFTCGATFPQRDSYRRHCSRQLDLAYRKYRLYSTDRCDVCDKQFATMFLLNTHKCAHNSEHPCPHCSATLSTKTSLICHVRDMHVSKRQFACTECEYKATAMSTLSIHMRTHSTTKRIHCQEPGCNASYKYKYSLQRHMAKHNIPPVTYGCHFCETVFSIGMHLTKHLVSEHHMVLPSRSFGKRYKVDQDGIFRWGTFVDAQSNAKATERESKGKRTQKQ